MSSVSDFITLGEKGRDLVKAASLPIFDRAEYGGILPEVIALPMSAGSSLNSDYASDMSALAHLKKCEGAAWCHELRLRIWVRNTSSRLLSIIGIAPNKRVLNSKYYSAVLFQPQGSIGGDVVRFECDLDKDVPSMRRFTLEGVQRRYISSEYYFDEGLLEIEPDHTACISIIFSAKSNVYEVSPEIIVKLNQNIEAVSVLANQRGIVCPSSFIPDDGKMVRTFSDEPPFVINNSERFNACLQH